MFIPDDETHWARGGKPLERTPSKFRWDVFCPECEYEFNDWTQELVQHKDHLSDWQYTRHLRKIGWEFQIDPECVRQYIWRFDD